MKISVALQVKRLHVTLLALMLAWLMVGLAPCWSQQKSDQFVILETTKGRIVIRVAYSLVPYTAGNFLELVQRGFYDGLTFHRVESWVVQGGDPQGNGTGHFVDPQTGRTRFLQLETNPRLSHNQAGMVAMARSADRNSASCQFYILKQPMPQLNGQYAVFGKVVEGMNAVYAMRIGDRILSARIAQQDDGSQQGTTNNGERSQPRQQAPASPTGDSGF